MIHKCIWCTMEKNHNIRITNHDHNPGVIPIINDYVGLRDTALEELRCRKLDALCKANPNKMIVVTKDNQVFIQK